VTVAGRRGLVLRGRAKRLAPGRKGTLAVRPPVSVRRLGSRAKLRVVLVVVDGQGNRRARADDARRLRPLRTQPGRAGVRACWCVTTPCGQAPT
jgi:hypothetical protein